MALPKKTKEAKEGKEGERTGTYADIAHFEVDTLADRYSCPAELNQLETVYSVGRKCIHFEHGKLRRDITRVGKDWRPKLPHSHFGCTKPEGWKHDSQPHKYRCQRYRQGFGARSRLGRTLMSSKL